MNAVCLVVWHVLAQVQRARWLSGAGENTPGSIVANPAFFVPRLTEGMTAMGPGCVKTSRPMWLFKKHPKNRASTQNLGLLSRHLFSDFTYERDHRKAAGFSHSLDRLQPFWDELHSTRYR